MADTTLRNHGLTEIDLQKTGSDNFASSTDDVTFTAPAEVNTIIVSKDAGATVKVRHKTEDGANIILAGLDLGSSDTEGYYAGKGVELGTSDAIEIVSTGTGAKNVHIRAKRSK